MHNKKMEMLRILAITTLESIFVTAFVTTLGDEFLLLQLIRIFTTPLFVCLIGMNIFKQDFARISTFIFLFIDMLICSFNNLGWDSVLILLHIEENWESLLVIETFLAATIICQIVIYLFIVAVMKEKWKEGTDQSK